MPGTVNDLLAKARQAAANQDAARTAARQAAEAAGNARPVPPAAPELTPQPAGPASAA